MGKQLLDWGEQYKIVKARIITLQSNGPIMGRVSKELYRTLIKQKKDIEQRVLRLGTDSTAVRCKYAITASGITTMYEIIFTDITASEARVIIKLRYPTAEDIIVYNLSVGISQVI